MGKRSRRKALRRKTEAQPAPPATDEPQDDFEERRELELRVVELIAELDKRIHTRAYEMFLAEGGDVIEQMLENGQLTMAAYHSQIRAEKEGGSGWGPTVTPYEDRMTRSLQMRLMREKREWIERCRQRILDEQKALEERVAPEDEPEENAEEEAPDTEDTEFGYTGEPASKTEATTEPVMTTADSPQ